VELVVNPADQQGGFRAAIAAPQRAEPGETRRELSNPGPFAISAVRVRANKAAPATRIGVKTS
jgi:hypothetical protein